MSDLHAAIMNLPIPAEHFYATGATGATYLHGHRDARHAAAELAAQYAASHQRLKEALARIAAIEDKMFGGDWDEIEEARAIARAALKDAP